MSGRRLTDFPAPPGTNSLWPPPENRNSLKIFFNFLLLLVVRYSPSRQMKCDAMRFMGVKVGKKVSMALEATVDVVYPELIEIGDNSIVGYRATILAHEYLIDRMRTGPVIIGKNVLIGANTTILAGVSIGDDAIVAAGSMVTCDVPAGKFVAGVPARVINRDPGENGTC
ncbi:MAG TPA: acyltransferase [Methanocella sp.]|jgi:acetyltransferase-like isoleucine patch superfamily enzyme